MTWDPAMRWVEWEPVYETIRASFGFDRAADAAARDLLSRLLPRPATPDDCPSLVGNRVVIAGAASTLENELDRVMEADRVITASSGAGVVLDAGGSIDIHVTDLDEDPAIVDRLAAAEIVMAVHGHGDNQETIEQTVPSLEPARVLPTTQVEPTATVVNPGGFTDGDRAAFLAHALGAEELRFAGWDFDDPTVDPIKARKLAWAERLVYWLEQYRGESYDILDGRRSAIDLSPLPPP